MGYKQLRWTQCDDIISNCLKYDIIRLLTSSDNAPSELLALPSGDTFISYSATYFSPDLSNTNMYIICLICIFYCDDWSLALVYSVVKKNKCYCEWYQFCVIFWDFFLVTVYNLLLSHIFLTQGHIFFIKIF